MKSEEEEDPTISLSVASKSNSNTPPSKTKTLPCDVAKEVVLTGVKQGVPLREYEVVISRLLAQVQPVYHQLPPLPPPSPRLGRMEDDHDPKHHHNHNQQPPIRPSSCGEDTLWKFYLKEQNPQENGDDSLSSSFVSPARVYGELPGQLPNLKRALRKESQVRSLLRCIAACLLPLCDEHDDENDNSVDSTTRTDTAVCHTIVDFGGGSGHLALPLALLFPPHLLRVVVVDLNRHSLDLLHRKAEACMPSSSSTTAEMSTNNTSIHTRTQQEKVNDCKNKFQRTTISNLWTYCGPIDTFGDDHQVDSFQFHIGVALHLCGEATDVALRKCLAHSTCSAIVMAPCCVGKLNRHRKNPFIWQATGSNTPSITYPQSNAFANILLLSSNTRSSKGYNNNNANSDESSSSNNNDWNALAKAADYSQVLEYKSSRNATRRTAKALVEWDRCLFIQEHQEKEIGDARAQWSRWQVILTRMEPWEASPKNDILVATRRRYHDRSSSSAAVAAASVAASVSSSLPERKHKQNHPVTSIGGEHQKNDWEWSSQKPGLLSIPENDECMADIEWTRHHLQVPWKMKKVVVENRTATLNTAAQEVAKNSNWCCHNRKSSGADTTATATIQSTPNHVNNNNMPVIPKGEQQPVNLDLQQSKSETNNNDNNVDWTREEEYEMERFLHSHFFAGVAQRGESNKYKKELMRMDDDVDDNNAKNKVYFFPTNNMGKRKRKLVHHVADKLGLEHWSHRKKKGDDCGGRGGGGRTVAVARPGTRKSLFCSSTAAPVSGNQNSEV